MLGILYTFLGVWDSLYWCEKGSLFLFWGNVGQGRYKSLLFVAVGLWLCKSMAVHGLCSCPIPSSCELLSISGLPGDH